MRIVVIGGTGHIGTYLIPRLVNAGHDVVNISRGKRKPYQEDPAWEKVDSIEMSRAKEANAGTLGTRIAEMNPDIVIDNIGYNVESTQQLVEGLNGKIKHFLSTGTIWVHGEAEIVPTPEDIPRKPIGDYGINKNAMEQYLLHQARENSFPATNIHPGHIVGPGWPPLNPQGNFNLNVWQTIADGNDLVLPNLGLECVHHVHADDIAQLFELAINNPDASIGQSFHAVSAQSMTLLGYARGVYSWFKKEPSISFVPLEQLEQTIDPEDARQTREHIMRSPCMSIEKGRRLLGYEPKYSSLEACREAVARLIKDGQIQSDVSLD